MKDGKNNVVINKKLIKNVGTSAHTIKIIIDFLIQVKNVRSYCDRVNSVF